jgi:GTP diphosphokinase / guanosine-3',5'-bis(diphosphate) 3'-diphosphatase
LQIEHAPQLSLQAKTIKLADKICNLRDTLRQPPVGWGLVRCREYFEWASKVIDGVRGSNPALEAVFDQIYAQGIADFDEQVRRGDGNL